VPRGGEIESQGACVPAEEEAAGGLTQEDGNQDESIVAHSQQHSASRVIAPRVMEDGMTHTRKATVNYYRTALGSVVVRGKSTRHITA
jgi:hypothetical protein